MNKRMNTGFIAMLVMGFWAVGVAVSQQAAVESGKPWMDTQLSAEKRAELVLEQMTLDEKIAWGGRRAPKERTARDAAGTTAG